MMRYQSLRRNVMLFVAMVVAATMLVASSPASRQAFAATTTTTNAAKTTAKQSTSAQLKQRAKSSWPWYVTRASGLVAVVALVLLMLSGIGMLTGKTYSFIEPLMAWATHRALGIAFLGSVIVHVVVLLFDHFQPFTIWEILFPFVSKYKPAIIGGKSFGSLYLAFGILALYLIIAVVVSSILWIDKKPITWKLLHFSTYLIMIMVFFHALFLGTDLKNGTLRVLWIASSIAVAASMLIRAYRARTLEAK